MAIYGLLQSSISWKDNHISSKSSSLIMLRKNIRSSVFVLLALAACTSKNNVKITGEIKEAENQKVYLEQLNVDQAVIIDSTKTDRYGHFTFKTATSLPTFYNVKIGPK